MRQMPRTGPRNRRLEQRRSEIELDADDESAFDKASIAEREGTTIPLDVFRAILRRL